MDLDIAAKRAKVTAAVQAAAGSLVHVRSLLYFVAKSTGQAAALRADPPPAAADVAALLADVPAARDLLAASRAGRAAIRQAAAIQRPPGPAARAPSRPIAAAVEHIRSRWNAVRVAPIFPAGRTVVDDACRTLLSIDSVLRDLERMDPQVVLELLAPGEEGEP